MTTEQLERDLETLAEPRQGDERLRLEIRARLGEQMLARPPRRVRPRPRRRFGWAVAAAAVAAMAAVVVSLGSPGGSGGPSVANAAIIRHALRAISSPANAIVHVKEIGVQDGTTVGAEWWQETSAPHALRMIKGPVGGQREGASDGSTSFQYDARTNTIVETPNSSAPALVDPIAPVREQLARGDAQVEGTVTIAGQALYKIKLSTGVTGYFDKTDYRPVYLDNPQSGGSVVRTRVVAYEELPVTPDNEKLLSITAQHPDARVSTRQAPMK
jgi:hypothetical protein